jgi:hypothetical protein
VLAEQIDGKFLCQFLAGQIDRKKLQARALNGHVFTPEQWKQFSAVAKTVKQDAGAHALASTLAILQDICRFRLHLKYFRLAHRAFNRLRILRSEDDLKLSREAGSLYSLLTPSEQQDDQDRIVHHAIIKADVRGSTTVTEELQAKSLNPASYFSLRFFSPINALLPIYGAGKVFIEGDAVILSLLEHEKSPQQWFAVARACGLARAMLNVVHANNLHSEQMGLPKLEVGIGLCYAPSAPLFLYDEDKPIMISGAIGKADRLSSCTWKLRRIIQPGGVQCGSVRTGRRRARARREGAEHHSLQRQRHPAGHRGLRETAAGNHAAAGERAPQRRSGHPACRQIPRSAGQAAQSGDSRGTRPALA